MILSQNLDRFDEADIHEHGAIEFDARHQIHDVNLKFQQLTLENRKQMIEENVEMLFSVSERNHDGDSMPRHAVGRLENPTSR